MTEQKMTLVINNLLEAAAILFLCGSLSYAFKDHTKPEIIEEPLVFESIVPDNQVWVSKIPEEPQIVKNEVIIQESELRNQWINIPISYVVMNTKYLGRYFITSYCPEECGWSWTTSSGTTCHYSDQWSEPTTCAIDRNFHGYYEIIQVGDGENKKLYRTEDTGPGVRGRWVDCFVETMDEVRAWNTRYDNVYAVSYDEKQFERRFIYHDYFNYNLLCNGIRSGYFPGPYNRAHGGQCSSSSFRTY